MSKFNCAGLAAIALAAMAQTAEAGRIVVEDSRCSQLDAANLSAVEQKLKETKVIAADDTIDCKVPAGSTKSQKNFPLTTLLPAFNALFCRQKNFDAWAACGKLADKAARDACEQDEKARFKGIRKAC
jgi:hypothetical protein